MSPWRTGTICRHQMIRPDYRTPPPEWRLALAWVAGIAAVVVAVAVTA